MELSLSLRPLLLYPSAAFLDVDEVLRGESERLDSLTEPFAKLETFPTHHGVANWRIDGCGPGGTQLYVVPLFLPRITPLAIDVFIPDPRDYSFQLGRYLEVYRLCHQGDGSIAGLKIIDHIVCGLQHWLAGSGDLNKTLQALPFGSQIIINSITSNPLDMDIVLVPGYEVERRMVSLHALKDMWQSDILPERWPPVIDIEELDLYSRLKDSISVVRIVGQPDRGRLVFKYSLQQFPYLYHELRLLMTLPPHPNILASPAYIVTKKCSFGGKLGVCGFLIPFYESGSLGEIIPKQAVRRTLTVERKFGWAIQATQAMIHLLKNCQTYFSDLRPDNIISSLRDDGIEELKIIDFEQRGNWYTWSPPEVFYLEYLQLLGQSDEVPEEYRLKCKSWLHKINCGRGKLVETYDNNPLGYNEAWNCLSSAQQESATVYMLGKLLWCIFEEIEVTSPFETFLRSRSMESPLEFPNFVRTPELLRGFILDCTVGAPEHDGHVSSLVRIGSEIYTRGNLKQSLEQSSTAIVKEILTASKSWWQGECERMEIFIQQLERRSVTNHGGRESSGQEPIFQRPSLNQVLKMLEDAQRELG